MRKTLVVLAAGLMLMTTASAACELPDIVGKAYPEAREDMIVAGWTPEPQRGPIEERARYMTWVRDRLYDEVESCAGTGIAPCRFAFSRGSKRAIVFTIYEEIGEVAAAHCGAEDIPGCGGSTYCLPDWARMR